MSQPDPGVPQPPPTEPIEATPTAPQLPASPRSLAGKASGVVTFEPRVRLWFLVAAALLVIMAYRALGEVATWSHERHLITAGTPAVATIVEINGTQLTQMREPWSSPIRLKYTAGNKTMEAAGALSEMPDRAPLLTVGQTVNIRYDPARPEEWTNRTTPASIVGSLVVVYIMLPVVAATAGAGLLQRRALAETWRSGELSPAAVISVSPTPIAPGHSRVTVRSSAGRDAPMSVYFPSRFGKPRRGDVVWILLRKTGPAMAAQAFL